MLLLHNDAQRDSPTVLRSGSLPNCIDATLARGHYHLGQNADFPGRYTQSTGCAGLSTSGGSDSWLQNNAGVIMHLQGTENGAMLSLGKEEIFTRMAPQ